MDKDVEIVLSDLEAKDSKSLCQWPCWWENKIGKCVGHVLRKNIGYAQKELCILRLRQKRYKKIASWLW